MGVIIHNRCSQYRNSDEIHGEKGLQLGHYYEFQLFLHCCSRENNGTPAPHAVLQGKDRILFFYDRKYMKTRSPLFNDKAIKKGYCLLKAILLGEYSDIPGHFCGF